jgi:predicted nucleic acid-binding protein
MPFISLIKFKIGLAMAVLRYFLHQKMAFVGLENCYISEITLAELKIGAEKSLFPAEAHATVTMFARHQST